MVINGSWDHIIILLLDIDFAFRQGAEDGGFNDMGIVEISKT